MHVCNYHFFVICRIS